MERLRIEFLFILLDYMTKIESVHSTFIVVMFFGLFFRGRNCCIQMHIIANIRESRAPLFVNNIKKIFARNKVMKIPLCSFPPTSIL